MRRIAAAVAALVLPVQAQALGVGGDIEWHSALNQPLDAEISLFALGATGQDDIKVKLAPYEAYERAGVEYPSILRDLKFSVERHPGGDFYIKLHSTNPIKDPFLDILVEIDWPSGHLLREYTVLLDLPVMTDEVAGPVSTPAISTLTSVSPDSGTAMTTGDAAAAPAAMASGSPVYGDSGPRAGSGELRYGMVKRGDTLWGIAESMRTDKSVSVQQVMIALLKNNPDAFYDNNINNLKAGYVLRLDDPAMLTDTSKSAALRETQRQYKAWMAAKKGGALSTTRPGKAQMGSSVGAGAETGINGPSLKLVAPDEADVTLAAKTAAGDGQSRSFNNKDLESLRQELTVAMESSDSGRQENTQLRARIAELEEQIGKMQRLLSLRDDALTVLQTQPQESVSADTIAAAEPAAAMDAAGQDTATAETAAVVTPPAKKPAKPVPVKVPESEQGVIDMVLGYVNKAVAAVSLVLSPVILGGIVGGALLLGGGLWFMRKRRISGNDLEQSMMIEVADKQLSEDMANGTVSDLSESRESTTAVDLLNTSSADNIEADIDEIDVLAEADVYLAYQRFDRAEELLRDAVEHEPQRHDLMLKLMEVFVASKNRDGFVEMAERCQASGGQQDEALWRKVTAMGSSIAADHPLFSATVTDVDNDEPGEDLPGGDLDMDFSALDDDLMSGLEADDDNPVVDADLSDELGGLKLGDDELPDFDAEPELNDDNSLDMLSGDEPAVEPVSEEADSAVVHYDNALDYDEDDSSADAETPVAAEVDMPSESSVDNGLEFDGGLDRSDDEELSLDSAPLPSDSGLEYESVDGLDDDIELTAVDDGGLEFDSSVLESVSTELQLPDDEEDDNPVILEMETDDSGIDADLSDDIDWLTSVADDAADGDDDSNSLFSSEDEVATKLDLIRAYIDMGDNDSARNILTEVVEEGNADQKQEAQELLRQMG